MANHLPFELGVRGAAVDLRTMEGFGRVLRRFSPGAMLTYVIADKVYALPETQDFWVLFYRRDILSALGLRVPDTWDDVKAMMSVLQRYGMSFHIPMAGAGFKSLIFTSPFIYQAGGELYSPDTRSVAIDSEAALEGMRLMTELFTLYGMPLSVPNFYANFRNGSVPIGVANFEVYLKLVTAAPEIAGWWEIAPHPGVARDGKIWRWAPGSAQAMMILKGPRADEAWKFLDWWSSTETQVEFQERLRASYGDEYIWSSANLEAFRVLAIPPEHRGVILGQWDWIREITRVPGYYLLERGISDAWNRVVFNGENPRTALDEAVVAANRETARKLRELGASGAGIWPADPRLPTIELIQSWQEP
jgi:ABC-type glycerol-3-phosphate transport system substrate-binding protein